MFGKIIQNWKTYRALKAIEKEPIYTTAVHVLRKYLVDESEGLAKYAPQKMKEKIMGDTLIEVGEVVIAKNQILANRSKLAAYVLQMAKYQVLILPPNDEEDITGLRGKPGITGELKSHIMAIAEKDKEIKEIKWSIDNSTETDIFEACLYRYWMYHIKASVFNVIRGHLKDNHPSSEKDWYIPFVEAMCAWEEYQFRELIGLSNVLDKDSDSGSGILEAIQFSTFLDFVVNGATYPNFEWAEAIKEINSTQDL